MTVTSPETAVDHTSESRSPLAAHGLSRWQKLIGILGLVVVLWVGDRLSDAISSGGIGSDGDHQPAGGPPSTQPTDSNQPPSGGGSGGHDPSQFDHG